MRKRIRLGVGTVVALAALAFASQAFAAYTPKLAVQMGTAGTTIHLTIPSTDDPTALLVFYAPAGTVANLGATAGTTIGTLDAKAAAGALGGATLPLTGTVEARAADGTYLSSGVQVPLAAAATRCTGTATHAGFWVLKLTAAGQTLEVPLFVDPVSGALAVAASYSLTVCLPPSDIPESLGGAAFGAKVFEANFTVKGVFTATSGQNVWRLRATPYTPGEGHAEPAGDGRVAVLRRDRERRARHDQARADEARRELHGRRQGDLERRGGWCIGHARQGHVRGEGGRVLAPGRLGRGHVLVEGQRPPRCQAAAPVRQGDGKRAGTRPRRVRMQGDLRRLVHQRDGERVHRGVVHEGPARSEEVANERAPHGAFSLT